MLRDADEESLAWMVLSRSPRLDVPTLSQAFQDSNCDSAARLLRDARAALQSAALPPAARGFLADACVSERERAWARHPHHHLVSFLDARYPRQLRGCAGAPIALYVAGDPAILNDPQLSIVGSRNPTPAGRDTAFEFAKALAACGLCITSGLAEGIDSAAHDGAIAAHGVTIAVLGSGTDVIYPRQNVGLGHEIEKQGALISEFPLGTPPRAKNFPRRNNIIAALSLGTLVVEAAMRSGSLITARLAGEHNREVFAVPGSIHNPLSRGCHELIRNGAKLTETAADILSELNFSGFSYPVPRADSACSATAEFAAGMDKDHKILLDALGFDPADLDALVVRTGLQPQTVSSMMVILELEGHVQAAPGGRYSRVCRSRSEG
jgi:DNA processing protein